MKRKKSTGNILIVDNKRKRVVGEKSFLSQLGVSGMIRIENTQYRYFPQGRFLAYFNLEKCGHEVGKVYALLRIMKHGHYSGIKNIEQFPLLSFKKIIFGKCIKVEQKLKYADLKQKHFKYSFSNIKNTKQLKDSILARYTKSLPDLDPTQILNLGISYTLLEII